MSTVRRTETIQLPLEDIRLLRDFFTRRAKEVLPRDILEIVCRDNMFHNKIQNDMQLCRRQATEDSYLTYTVNSLATRYSGGRPNTSPRVAFMEIILFSVTKYLYLVRHCDMVCLKVNEQFIGSGSRYPSLSNITNIEMITDRLFPHMCINVGAQGQGSCCKSL